jgi:hypothetical protein
MLRVYRIGKWSLRVVMIAVAALVGAYHGPAAALAALVLGIFVYAVALFVFVTVVRAVVRSRSSERVRDALR